ncbi:MAG: NnrU family protein [Burkholderiales bacterium]
MDPYAHLALATAAFLATHFVPATPLRPALVRALGERPYIGLYSLVAIATLGWMIWAYVEAPRELLWPGLRLVPAAVMPFSFILLACGFLTRNPSLVLQHRLLKAKAPARGILRVTRHPIQWAIMLWAGAHVLARGDIKSLIFFGGLIALSAVGTVLMDHRKAKTLGDDWRRFAVATSNVPFVAITKGRNRFEAREIGWRNPALGLALYAVFFWAHPWLFGARPY